MTFNIKRIAFLALALYFGLITSCGNTKELSESTEWSLSLKKGGCMDVCDSYEILIQSSGEFDYKGIHGVKVMGQKTGELSKAKLKEIEVLVGSIDWYNLDSEYGSSGNGTQRKELIYTTGEKRVTVLYHRLEPQEIRKLEQLIDQIINGDEL